MRLDILWIVSPILVMAACHAAAKYSVKRIKSSWRWLPNLLFFWALLLVFMWSHMDQILELMLVPSLKFWAAAPALLVGFIPLPILLFHRHLLRPLDIRIAWLAFGLINPFFEEFYWRGLLTVVTASWPEWLAILYTSLLFALNHKIAWEPISPLMGSRAVLVSTFIMGVVWSTTVLHGGALIWVIISHILVDLFNLAVPVYMNRYVPNGSIRGNGCD